jgi:hypothetical protein
MGGSCARSPCWRPGVNPSARSACAGRQSDLGQKFAVADEAARLPEDLIAALRPMRARLPLFAPFATRLHHQQAVSDGRGLPPATPPGGEPVAKREELSQQLGLAEFCENQQIPTRKISPISLIEEGLRCESHIVKNSFYAFIRFSRFSRGHG